MKPPATTPPFKVGDSVRPKAEYDWSTARTGKVRDIVPWGTGFVVYVEGDHRGFISDVFELADTVHA
jgi:hypothetical protein